MRRVKSRRNNRSPAASRGYYTTGDCNETTFCKHLVNVGTRAGAGTGSDTGADTKVKICLPRKLPPAKRGQISV